LQFTFHANAVLAILLHNTIIDSSARGGNFDFVIAPTFPDRKSNAANVCSALDIATPISSWGGALFRAVSVASSSNHTKHFGSTYFAW
jgi:hypothetical protein